jgi:hypothetical protein
MLGTAAALGIAMVRHNAKADAGAVPPTAIAASSRASAEPPPAEHPSGPDPRPTIAPRPTPVAETQPARPPVVAPPVAAVAPAAPVPTAPETVHASTATAPAPAAGPFTVRVESDPEGAAVIDLRSHRRVGTTPADVRLDQPGTLALRLTGYREERLEAHRADTALHATLHKARAPSPTPGAPSLPRLPAGHETRSNGIGLDD